MTVTELQAEVASGDRRRALVALRDHLATRLLQSGPRDTAGIAKMLAETVHDLDQLPTAAEVSSVARLADASAARRRRASGS